MSFWKGEGHPRGLQMKELTALFTRRIWRFCTLPLNIFILFHQIFFCFLSFFSSPLLLFCKYKTHTNKRDRQRERERERERERVEKKYQGGKSLNLHGDSFSSRQIQARVLGRSIRRQNQHHHPFHVR